MTRHEGRASEDGYRCPCGCHDDEHDPPLGRSEIAPTTYSELVLREEAEHGPDYHHWWDSPDNPNVPPGP